MTHEDWLTEWLHLHNRQMAQAYAKRVEDAILGTGVSKVSWNETCRCGQIVTVATLDAFRKTKAGVWRHKNPDDCIAALEGALAMHKSAINRQATRIDALDRCVAQLEKRRWWQR